MSFEKNLSFHEYTIDGWICNCGEKYYDSEQAQRLLVLNTCKNRK